MSRVGYFNSISVIEGVRIPWEYMEDASKEGFLQRDWSDYFKISEDFTKDIIYGHPDQPLKSKRLKELNEELFFKIRESYSKNFKYAPVNFEKISYDGECLNDRKYAPTEVHFLEMKGNADKAYESLCLENWLQPIDVDFRKWWTYELSFDANAFFSDFETLFKTDNDFLKHHHSHPKIEALFRGYRTEADSIQMLEYLIHTRSIGASRVYRTGIRLPDTLRPSIDIIPDAPEYDHVFYERGRYAFYEITNPIHG